MSKLQYNNNKQRLSRLSGICLIGIGIIVDAFNLQSNSLQLTTTETTIRNIRLQNDFPSALTVPSVYRHSSLNSVRISDSIPGDLSFPVLTPTPQQRQKLSSTNLIEKSNILLKTGNDDDDDNNNNSLMGINSISSIMEVISAILLITGNTVGAGIMVLPEVVAGPGMTMSIYLFLGKFGARFYWNSSKI